MGLKEGECLNKIAHNPLIRLTGEEEGNPRRMNESEATSVTIVLFHLAVKERCVEPQGAEIVSYRSFCFYKTKQKINAS